MRYFLYARKSTDSEDKQLASIDDQIAEMKRLANGFNLQIVDVISEAKSAKEPGRKEFNNMLKRIEKGEAEGILCWKLNRLARNPIDGGQISWLLQRNVIKHIQTYGREYKSSDNVLMMQVEFGMANQFINDLREDVKRGMRQKAERGWYPNKIPPGYMHVNQKQRVFGKPENIPHPEHFYSVQRLWKLFLTGKYSVLEIKKEGDRLGLCHKNGNLYSKNVYYKMLSSEFYCGVFYWRDCHNTIIRYPGHHKPIITVREFEKAQTILGKRKCLKTRKHTYLYRGLITCGECKGHVTAEQKLQAICTTCKSKFSIITNTICPQCKTDISQMHEPTRIEKIYYYCTGNKTTCSQKRISISEEVIEKSIREELEKVTIGKKFCDWGLPQIQELNRTFANEETQIIAKIKKRHTELSQRLEGLIRMRADSEISTTEFNTLKEQTLKEIQNLEAQKENSQNIEENLNKAVTEYFDFALNALKEFDEGGEIAKKRVVEKLASNLELKEKKLYISTDIVYKMVKECENVYQAKRSRSNLLLSLKNIAKKVVFDLNFPFGAPM